MEKNHKLISRETEEVTKCHRTSKLNDLETGGKEQSWMLWRCVPWPHLAGTTNL
ncbi:unnamed protein product [Callosobruchus maculatus]|uniref:Uncharacterized protein n=1 Tax=Callosobruchus maculatus TaxID=64391 RepID=A0A653D369_CALMS|nr:unnamed protein product [Callosobruchus maculatus]